MFSVCLRHGRFLEGSSQIKCSPTFSVFHPPGGRFTSLAGFLPQLGILETLYSLSASALMKSKCFLLMTALLISCCTQVNDQFYSKKNFTSESFRADASACRRQKARAERQVTVLGWIVISSAKSTGRRSGNRMPRKDASPGPNPARTDFPNREGV